MVEKSIYEQIKKQNGEHFAKAIRGYDNGIFDIPGIVDIVKYAGHEAEPIMDYLESLKDIQIEETGVYQDPLTLLDAAGYNAYYVTNLEEQNAIQKYYAKGEELCTFRDPHRFENYHIINAVRKDVDQIKREDFRGKVQREDRYGTSVLSIQILKTGDFISIKNRYNHTVQNPDNTFGSNPDKIIPGLANALRHHFDTDFSAQNAYLPHGYVFINNQMIRYNYEQDNIYFGSNFYVKDGVVHRLQSHEILVNSFVLDLKTKKLIYPGAVIGNIDDQEDKAFKEVFLKETEGYAIAVRKDDNGQHLYLHKPKEKDKPQQPDIEFLCLKEGVITSLNLPTTTKIGDNFLKYGSGQLRSLTAPNLEYMGNECFSAPPFKSLDLPKLKRLGHSCFVDLHNLRSLDLPLLTQMGFQCFHSMWELRSLNLPALKMMSWGSFSTTEHLETVYLPSLTKIGDGCFCGRSLREISLPVLKAMGMNFGGRNLEKVILPCLSEMGQGSLAYAESLETFYAPLLKKRPLYFGSYTNPIKRMCVWFKRKQIPEGYSKETGISATLAQAGSTKQESKGISGRLQQRGNTSSHPQEQNTSFFKKLRDLLIPQK